MFKIKVNGKTLQADVEADTPLLWVLRDEFHLNGTKFSCGKGLCGACTVLLNGQAVRSCQLPVSALTDEAIVTIEGLQQDGQLHDVQKAWIDVDVPQCGYCQSGQILSAVALLSKHKTPTDEQIDQAMNNLCRCGSYPEIRQAVHQAVNRMNKGDSHEN